jgi:glutaredoxin
MKNVKIDNPARKELEQQGGYLVVPCLIVNGQAIYDANDIIDWLSAHQDDLPKSKK